MKKILPYFVVGSPQQSHPILKPVTNSKADKNAVIEKEFCKLLHSHSTAFKHYQ